MQKSKLQFKIPKYLKFLLLTYIFAFCILPFDFVLASNVYIDTTRSEFFEGDTILFHIRIDSEGKNINAVEGEVLLDHEAGAVSLTDINISGSPFALWPGRPLPSERNTYISFAGGAPGGFNSKDAIVFNIVLKLHKTGQVALSPNDIDVYLHDGKGTKDEVSVKDLVVNVLPKKPGAEAADDWSKILLNDKTAPEFIEAIISRDLHLFDNQYFVSFFAVDKNSGVAYFEIKEGERDFVRAESPYLLQDQSLKSIVQIKAADKAGNESIVTPELPPVPIPGIPYKTYLFWIFVTLVILVVIFWLWRKNVKLKSQNEK